MQKYLILDLSKNPETGQNARFSENPKKFSPIPYVLNSNPWLALIPTVGYVSNNLDHHGRTQSIILMEKNCKLHS